MRVMEIRPFPHKIEINDLDNIVRTRLSQRVAIWPEQAIGLIGYMFYPNDPETRTSLMPMLREWLQASEDFPHVIPHKLKRIQYNWLRVADVFHVLYDLVTGEHQARRGGPSIGKANALVAARAKNRGTGAATSWKHWSTYKNVAHLVVPACMICRQSRHLFDQQPFGPSGLRWHELYPFQMAMMMPDLVIALAIGFEHFGLSFVPHARSKPELDPETLWRIPPDIDVVPIPPPGRTINAQDRKVLNARRAGNRGKARKRQTPRRSESNLRSAAGPLDHNERRPDRTGDRLTPSQSCQSRRPHKRT